MEFEDTPMKALVDRLGRDPQLRALERILPTLPVNPFGLRVIDIDAGLPAGAENGDILNATALVVAPDNDDFGERRAVNCGGNIYIKEQYRHWYWNTVGPAIIHDKMPGPGGSRFMNGTTEDLSAIEHRVANWLGYEHTLFVNTGYNAVQVAIDTLVKTGVSKSSKVKPFAIKAKGGVHNSVEAPIRDLEERGYLDDKSARREKGLPNPEFDPMDPETLVDLFEELEERAVSDRIVFINGVGSTDGMVYDLRRIQEICKEHGALLFVDDAHGGFTLGRNSKGICEYLGLEELPDFYFVTASKSAGSNGGFLATNEKRYRDAAANNDKVKFTAADSEWKFASIEAKLDFIEASLETGIGESEKLQRNAQMLTGIFQRGEVGIFDTDPNTPIYGLKVPKLEGEGLDDYRTRSYLAWMYLLDNYGIYTNFFPAEASGKGESLLRVSISSNMSQRVIKLLGMKFVRWSREINGQEALTTEEMAYVLGGTNQEGQLAVSPQEVEELIALDEAYFSK